MSELENCDICYDDCHNVITLDCCNKSKKICKDCLSCLRKPTCPYCRKTLPEDVLSNMIVVRSLPNEDTNQPGFYSLLQSELLVDPFDPEFQDSRILRRQVRRIRRRFISEHSRNRPSARDRRTERKRERRFLRQQLNDLTHAYNHNQTIFDIEL